MLDRNKRAWDSKLWLALWADRVTMKKAIGCAAFDLVYGISARLSQNNLLQMYKLIQAYDEDLDDEMRVRMDELIQLDETRRNAHERNEDLQKQCKSLYDRRATQRSFKIDDMVLMWNARLEDKGKHGKFDPIWLGPYLIENK